LPFFKQNLGKILLGIFCMIVVDMAQLIVPQIIKQAIDALAAATPDRQTLMVQCLFIVGLGLFMALLRYGWRVLLMGAARDLERGIRDKLYTHVLSLDMGYYDRTKTGDIMAHATSDINHVRMAFGFGLVVMVDTILLGGTCIAIMVWTNPTLTALTLIPMPFLVVATKILGKKVHLFHRTAQEAFSTLTEQIREGFFGIRVIKVFNFEPVIREKVDTAATDYFRKNLKRAFVNALLRPLLGFFFNISTLIIIFYGGWLVMQKTLSPGELVAFLQYLGILAWPIIAIGWITNLFQRGLASLKRIQALLDARPDISPPEKPVSPVKVNGGIEFTRVDFAYNKEVPVLKSISMDIAPGMKIGITGPPGSGKTSLIQLIPRLYDPVKGNIRLDGHNLTGLDPEFLRQQIALMPQEPFLFSGTLNENILMGRRIEADKLQEIIGVCDLKATIAEMPDGLATIVGERGVTLSGGQKQRVALARTLIADTPVLLLDDPVSQLDTQTAQHVIDRINRLNPDATMIMVSHRLSALAGCDRIYILDKGVISDQGSHDRLKETNAFYRESYRVQQFEEVAHV
ncbi:MAG: ABC transporter ATP-binding protein/permease, partial [Desulfobacterales bacterium]|nr:ABC transporter ATP-binding protein/permease [Desulfobacterales bacterium]